MDDKTSLPSGPLYRAYCTIVTAFIYSMAYLFVSFIIFMVIALNLDSYYPVKGPFMVGLLILSFVPATVFSYFKWKGAKWRREHPEEYAAEQASKEADAIRKQAEVQAKIEYDRANPSEGMKIFIGFMELVEGLVKLIGGFVAVAVIGWIIYAIFTSISTPVAILLGAVIIGFCILAAAS